MNHKTSNSVENIAKIINQLPEINYDGSKISTSLDEPLYLYDESHIKVVVVDPSDQLSYADKEKIPVILASNRVIFSLPGQGGSNKANFTIEYPKLLGSESKLFTPQTLGDYFGQVLSDMNSFFIYFAVPSIIAIRFLGLLLEKTWMIAVVYLTAYFFKIDNSIKQSTRMVLFASGPTTLLTPIIMIIVPEMLGSMILLQLWIYYLMFGAIWKVKSSL